MAFVERKLESVKWDTPQKLVQGRLKKISKVKFADGIGLRYTLRSREGLLLEVPGTTNINAKLSPSDIGLMVAIRFDGEDEKATVRAGQSKPKLFTVMVDESDRETGDPTQITDDDIPF